MGALLSELYPAALRGSGQGFCYSVGRGIGGFFPLCIGVLSSHVTLARSISGFTVTAYVMVIVAAWALPETRGRDLRTLESPAQPELPIFRDNDDGSQTAPRIK